MDEKYRQLRYIVLDVDGTMTDGGIYYDSKGNELKKFNTRDAAGIFAMMDSGIKVIVLTGRECPATKTRMEELKVNVIAQNVKNKKDYLSSFMRDNKIDPSQIGYVGDEMNDYAAMKLCGFKACPADAADEIKEIVDYVSTQNGGYGVIRDVAKFILIRTDSWNGSINNVYGAK